MEVGIVTTPTNLLSSLKPDHFRFEVLEVGAFPPTRLNFRGSSSMSVFP